MAFKIITDESLFPRSEYYSRYEGTTAFNMDNPSYIGTYHRSEGTRHFKKVGGRKNAAFLSPCATKPKKTNSFSAHTGGVCSPFTNPSYKKVITLREKTSNNRINVRDELLEYKRKIALTVVSVFKNKRASNTQKNKKTNSVRPIVFEENGYPCVLVQLPALNPLEMPSSSAKYWNKHPKPFQNLLLASFVALLNYKAQQSNIPIEIVLRSSFGHNLPSVCETNNTFRINVGVVPEAYAELMAEALNELDAAITTIMSNPVRLTNFSPKFLNDVHWYNVHKLKHAIDNNEIYKTLRNNGSYQNAENSPDAYNKLHTSFQIINTNHGVKGRSRFFPVELDGKNIWEMLQKRGDSMGKSILSECFRKNQTVDWFVNSIMDFLMKKNPLNVAIECALEQLVGCLTYSDKASMDYERIQQDLKAPKRKFNNTSFQSFYDTDASFNRITTILFSAFRVKQKPSSAIYQAIEHAGVAFYTNYKGSDTVLDEADYGSDSEFSDDFSSEENSLEKDELSNESSDELDPQKEEHLVVCKKKHFSHKKLRVCSGMKAILLSQFTALSYLKSNKILSFEVDVQQMYYEVEAALAMVNIKDIQKNKIRAIEGIILHYDLNFCNAENINDTMTLDEKLTALNPRIVILDVTSATQSELKVAAKTCFAQNKVEVVLLVHSGLKNSQGGMDFNPYGELRIMARNSKLRDKLMGMAISGLSEKDKLPPEVHEQVRASKRRGLEISLYGFFKTQYRRFQPKQPIIQRTL